MRKELNVDIGKRIKAVRIRIGMTREKLAELVDVTPRFIADVERGSVGISIATLKRICEVMNISSDSLLWDKTAQTSIDEKLKFVDPDCIEIIEKTVQTEIELINLIKNKE